MLLLVGTIVVYIYEDVAGDMVAKQPQQLMVRRLSKLWQRQGAAIILRVLLIYLRESSSGTSDLDQANGQPVRCAPWQQRFTGPTGSAGRGAGRW